MVRSRYDTQRYPFQQKLKDAFAVDRLDTLRSDARQAFTRERDQSSAYHGLFYRLARTEEFLALYDAFIREVIQPFYGEAIVYQAIPTFRIAFPGNVAVGEFHKDKDYRDAGWALQVREDNWFLPLTDAYGTNTIWAESAEDRGDFRPIECTHGEIVRWDGSNLMHGNRVNETGHSRVSFDFRIIRSSLYRPSERGSINTGTKFRIGAYYRLMR